MGVDESLPPSNTTAFAALHHGMLMRQVLALCMFVRSEYSEPRLSALLPHTLPGNNSNSEKAVCFSLIEVPFSNDIRNPETKEEFLGEPVSRNHAGMALASAFIREFRLSNDNMPGLARNPHMMRHYSTLESLALGDDWSDDENEQHQNDFEALDQFIVRATNS